MRDTLGADFIRVIAKMGDPRNSRDPWRHMGGRLSWLTDALIGEITDHVHDRYGLKVEWTLLGDMFGVETTEAQTAWCQRFATGLRDRWHKVELLEVMNEYGVNGGTTQILRHMGRTLRAEVPADVLISLSSPNGTHQGASREAIHAEVTAMYDGDSGANAITPHWDRTTPDTHVPPDLGPSAPSIVYCNEPRGPMSSVRQTSDPAQLARDYERAMRAGYRGYVFHTDAGVWSDRVEDSHKRDDRGQWTHVYDHDYAEAIARELKALRTTGRRAGGGHWR